MQAGNLLFVLVIIFVNAAITNAQTCGQCISTAKSTFRSDRRTCKADFRSGTTSRPEFKACKMMGKSDMYSDMATCYQSGNPCYAPAPAPAPSSNTDDWYLSNAGESCDTVCANNGGSCEVAAINQLNNQVRTEFVANVVGISVTSRVYANTLSTDWAPGYSFSSGFGTDGNSTCDGSNVLGTTIWRLCCCGPNCDYE